MTNEPPDANEMQSLADQPSPSFVSEFWQFLRHNKKWWLLPILVLFLLLGTLIVLSSGGAAPFIYTLF